MAGLRRRTAAALRWTVDNRHAVFFGVTFVTLAALISWWAVHLHALEEQRHRFSYKELRLEARFFASLFGHIPNPPRDLAGVSGAARLRYVPCDGHEDLGASMRPFHAETCLAPTEEAVAEVEREHRSKSLMVFGEGGLSLVLIVLRGWMFLRLVAAERRSRAELRDLWSRVSHELKTPVTA